MTDISHGGVSSFQQALHRFEELLADRAPAIRAALRPGLTDQEIRRITREIPHQLPSLVMDLYRWHDGTEFVLGPYRAELFPEGQMFPLAEAVRLRADAIEGDRKSGDSLWQSSWLPVFTEGKEVFRVVTLGDDGGQVLYFDFVDLPDTITEFEGLDQLIESLIRRWAAGAYRQSSDGSVEEDPRIVAELYRAEDRQPVDINRLLRDLAEGSEDVHRRSLYLLRTRLYPAAVPGLIWLLSHGADRTRLNAAELLGELADPAAYEPLRRAAAQDADELVRALARKSVEKFGLDSVGPSGPE